MFLPHVSPNSFTGSESPGNMGADKSRFFIDKACSHVTMFDIFSPVYAFVSDPTNGIGSTKCSQPPAKKQTVKAWIGSNLFLTTFLFQTFPCTCQNMCYNQFKYNPAPLTHFWEALQNIICMFQLCFCGGSSNLNVNMKNVSNETRRH